MDQNLQSSGSLESLWNTFKGLFNSRKSLERVPLLICFLKQSSKGSFPQKTNSTNLKGYFGKSIHIYKTQLFRVLMWRCHYIKQKSAYQFETNSNNAFSGSRYNRHGVGLPRIEGWGWAGSVCEVVGEGDGILEAGGASWAGVVVKGWMPVSWWSKQ